MISYILIPPESCFWMLFLSFLENTSFSSDLICLFLYSSQVSVDKSMFKMFVSTQLKRLRSDKWEEEETEREVMQITLLFSRDKDNKEDYGNHNFFKPKKSTQQKMKLSRQAQTWLGSINASEWQEETNQNRRSRVRRSNVGEKTHVPDVGSRDKWRVGGKTQRKCLFWTVM